MKTILEEVSSEIVIKNSRFIAYLYPIYEENFAIDRYLDNIKKIHPKATHYCYGYIYQDSVKSSDDNEPGGTAGLPILNILDKEGLSYVLAIVVRYFGGIKLGAGGLVRAYSKACKSALELATIKEMSLGYLVELKVSYDKQKDIDYLLKDSLIVSKSFDIDVTYQINIKKEDIDLLKNYNYKIIKEIYF